jgi:hypothetical protein
MFLTICECSEHGQLTACFSSGAVQLFLLAHNVSYCTAAIIRTWVNTGPAITRERPLPSIENGPAARTTTSERAASLRKMLPRHIRSDIGDQILRFLKFGSWFIVQPKSIHARRSSKLQVAPRGRSGLMCIVWRGRSSATARQCMQSPRP